MIEPDWLPWARAFAHLAPHFTSLDGPVFALVDLDDSGATVRFFGVGGDFCAGKRTSARSSLRVRCVNP